ncbi:MAG: hypothetical protein AAFY71_08850 [Bacteroidota bacterium]
MDNLKEIWPLFVIVAILGGLVSFNVLQSRPSIEQVTEIRNEQRERRDAFLPAFEAMSFNLEVAENKTQLRKYPFPDLRYQISLKDATSFTYPDSVGKENPLFNLSDAQKPHLWVSNAGKFMRSGDKLTKKVGEPFYLWSHGEGEVDTVRLESRLFVDESIYAE